MRNSDLIIERLQVELPGVIAIHAFGSRAAQRPRPDSDLDLAVLGERPFGARRLWAVASALASRLNMDVDLVDLRTASTVMQHQILTTGERLWAADSRADLFEATVLNDKFDLDVDRQALLERIHREGRVHGG